MTFICKFKLFYILNNKAFFQTSCVYNIILAELNNYMQKAPSPLVTCDHCTKEDSAGGGGGGGGGGDYGILVSTARDPSGMRQESISGADQKDRGH